MNEVRVYDSNGKLKKVISEAALNERSDQQIKFPSMYNRKKAKKPATPPGMDEKVGQKPS